MAGTWSCTAAVPDRYPTEDLFQIIRRARIYAPALFEALVIDEAVTCALTHAPDEPGDAPSHCEFVLAARGHAFADEWPECIAMLKHMGAVIAGTPTPPAEDWPCDTGNGTCDADIHLFTVIQLANFNAGLKRGQVIDRAITCALYHNASTGTGYADGAAHCDWVEKAHGHAVAEDWDLCIEALDHSGGGRAEKDEEVRELAFEELLEKLREMLRRWRDRFPPPF
jgi:hypothetical protein